MLRLFLLFSFIATLLMPASAQHVIRRNSRYYVEEQSLPVRVEPLLTDVWSQYSSPFNDLCPLDSTGARCVVGCVATAMSQVMHYWQWPLQGVGSHTYFDEKGCRQTLTANFSEHRYDWGNMLDSYDSVQYTKEQGSAVALLASDCGISVNMRYGAESSGARSIYQPLALANYFDYDKGVQMYFRDFYSLDEITLMLKKELAAGRPVLISGYNPSGGHAYVLDGYDERDFFHACWGNPGGIDNNYTYLPYMTPNQPEWYIDGSPENGLNRMQMFTMGIMPSNHPDATGVEHHLFAFERIQAQGSDSIVVNNMSNIGWNSHNDSVAIMLRQGDSIICPLYTYDHNFLLEEIDDTAYTDTFRLSIPKYVTDGTYTITPMYRDNCTDGCNTEWVAARTCVGTPNYLIADIKDGHCVLSSDTASTSFLTLEDIDMPDHVVNVTRPVFTLKLRNHGPEMAGRIYLAMEDLSDQHQGFYMAQQGISIGANEEYTIHNEISKVWMTHPGDFRLHVLYESNLFSDDLIELALPHEIIIRFEHYTSLQLAFR